jgi:FtsH-binding integral membrane protein
LQLRRIYLEAAAALAALAALLAIATVLQGDFGETEGKIFATIAATFVAGSAVMAGIASLAQGSRWLGRAGIVLAAGGFLLWVEEIWAGHDSGAYWKVLGLVLVWTLVTLVGTTSALMTTTQRRLHVATLTCAAAAGLVVSVMILSENGDLWQLFAVLLILTLLGETLIPIMERASAAGARPAERELGTLGGVSVLAVRQAGRRGVRIGDRELPLAADESVVLRRS